MYLIGLGPVRPVISQVILCKENKYWIKVLGFLFKSFCMYRCNNDIFAEFKSVLYSCAEKAQTFGL